MREIRDQGGIPTGCSGQRNRKDSAEAVDDVGSKKQRDMQAGVVNGSVLKMVGKALPNSVEHGAEFPLLREHVAVDSPRCGRVHVKSGRCVAGVGRGVRFGCAVLHQLAYLLVERHLFEQCIDLPLDLRAGELRIGGWNVRHLARAGESTTLKERTAKRLDRQ